MSAIDAVFLVFGMVALVGIGVLASVVKEYL